LKLRRIQPKPVVEYETISLRLPTALLRTVDEYSHYLGAGSDRAYIVTQALELALESDSGFRKQRLGSAHRAPASARPDEP
jgi:hypothetical protein